MATFFGTASNPTDPGNASAATSPRAITPPASMTEGQLVFVGAMTREGGTPVITISVSEAGGQTWESLTESAGSNQTAHGFWCRFNGTWSADPSFAFTGASGSIPFCLQMLVFTPEDANSTWEEDVAESSGTWTITNPDLDFVITGISTADDSVAIAWGTARDDITWVVSGTGWTQSAIAQVRNSNGGDCSFSLAYFLQATAGSTGDATFTVSATGNTGLTKIVSFKEVPTGGTHLEFVQQPSDVVKDTVVSPDIVVEVLDAFDQLDTGYSGDVTLALATGTGAVAGTVTVAIASGLGTFDDIEFDTAGVKTIEVTADNADLDPVTSDSFEVFEWAATHLEFVQQPTEVQEDTAIAPSITVKATIGAAGSTDTDFDGDVTLVIGTNPTGGVISGGGPEAAVAGIATFAATEITKPGTGYTLIAQGSGLVTDESDAFNVTLEPATHLFFFQGPSNTQVDATISPAVVVRARNSENAVDTNYTGEVTIAIQTNPGTGVLTGGGGDLKVNAVAGVATFSDLAIDEAGDGYVLRATASGLTLADSGTFNITADAPPAGSGGGYFRMSGVLGFRL